MTIIDAVRRDFKVKKVTSSHRKNITEIIAEEPIDESALKAAIDATGYQVTGIKTGPYEEKWFSSL